MLSTPCCLSLQKKSTDAYRLTLKHTYTHTHTRTHACTHTHTHTHTQPNTTTHTQTHTHAHTHAHTHTRTHARTHTHRQTYAHKHAPAPLAVCLWLPHAAAAGNCCRCYRTMCLWPHPVYTTRETDVMQTILAHLVSDVDERT